MHVFVRMYVCVHTKEKCGGHRKIEAIPFSLSTRYFRDRIWAIRPGGQCIYHSCQLFHFTKCFIFIVDYVHLSMECGYVHVNIAALEVERGCKTPAPRSGVTSGWEASNVGAGS